MGLPAPFLRTLLHSASVSLWLGPFPPRHTAVGLQGGVHEQMGVSGTLGLAELSSESGGDP